MSLLGLLACLHRRELVRDAASPLLVALVVLLPLPTGAMPAPGDAGPTDPAVTSNTGAAQFRIPIAVPPGAGGFAPTIELAYSSRSGDGPFGVGWDLGIPEIHCSGRFGVPDFADCAQYELSGTLLVIAPESNPPTPNEDEYHTFVESFQRVRYYATSDHWIVEQPNGTKLFFGEDAGHRVSQGTNTARWLLQRMVDSFGVTIFFNYDTAINVGAAYPTSIFYGAGATASAGPREVRLVYTSDRLDPRLVFTGGIERKITRRLREIQVFGHQQLFRRYVFAYDIAEVQFTTDRSRLTWVQEFGSDCTDLDPGFVPAQGCTGLPRREFRYTDSHDIAGSLWESNDDYRVSLGQYPDYGGLAGVSTGFPQMFGDINGDGLTDRIQLTFQNRLQPATWATVLINSGSGFSATAPLAVAYQSSLDGLAYDQPRLVYEQIPVTIPGAQWPVDAWQGDGTIVAMCSIRQEWNEKVLSDELFHDGVESATTSTWADLVASAGAPTLTATPGSFEPRPSMKLVDLDSDGLADLVLSVRVSAVKRHFNCDGTPLATPEEFAATTTTVVFRK